MSVEILSEKDGIFKEQMQPLVEIQNLKKYYPIKKGILSKTVGHVKAVDGLDFSIYSGKQFPLLVNLDVGNPLLAELL